MSQHQSPAVGAPADVEHVRHLGPVEATSRACAAAAEAGDTFVTIDPKGAMAAAEAAARRLEANASLGPMDGVPVAVKDVIDTRGLRTAMASKHFADHVPEQDAAVVADLRRAGAVVVGKANCNEFSYGILGDVGAEGVVTTPHDPSRLAGGSSSGSAAAVAQGVVPVAVGTDTAGSVRVPAALCGVVGFKPTIGAVDTEGVYPLAPSFDTVGYFGTSVRDIESVLGATGVTRPAGADVERITAVALSDFRAIVSDPVVATPYDRVVDGLGLREVKTPVAQSGGSPWGGLYGTVRSREAYLVHRALVDSAPQLYQPETLALLRAGESVADEAVSAALLEIERLRQRFLDAFAEVDVLVCPTVPIRAPLADGTERHLGADLMSMSLPWNVLGWPALTLPVRVEGCHLPQSVQLVGKPGDDAVVLEFGRRVEQFFAESPGAAGPAAAPATSRRH